MRHQPCRHLIKDSEKEYKVNGAEVGTSLLCLRNRKVGVAEEVKERVVEGLWVSKEPWGFGKDMDFMLGIPGILERH